MFHVTESKIFTLRKYKNGKKLQIVTFDLAWIDLCLRNDYSVNKVVVRAAAALEDQNVVR